MKEAGIPDAAKRVYYGGYQNVHEADSVLKKIRSTQPETTLIACDADETAAVLLQAAAMARLRIPDDIAVTSYGNTLLSIPPLATVEQEPEKIGEIACFQLISIIENGPPEKPVREFVIPHVVYPEYIPDLTGK
jgi:DNA-binding LacI/PurR family transcriptional regulator